MIVIILAPAWRPGASVTTPTFAPTRTSGRLEEINENRRKDYQ